MLSKLRHCQKTSFVNLGKRSITSKDIFSNEPNITYSLKYDPVKQPEQFQKEYMPTHWLAKKTNKWAGWLNSPYRIRMFDTDRDTELGKFQWNSNGAFPNRIANVLFRSESLQTRGLMRYFMKRYDHRFTQELNKSEEQPRITPNSVFLYRDPSNYIINRRAAERLAVFLLLTQAWTIPAALMYMFLALYFNIFQKTVATSWSMVTRMDLLPETEQLHIIKIGVFGFPRSVLVNIKDLIKIEKEEIHVCKMNLFIHRPYEMV